MKSSVFFIFLLSILLCNSCKDPCKSVNCNNGDCVDGTCVCDFGWTGDNCEIERASLYKGFYEGPFNCGIGSDTMVLKVENIENTLTGLKMHTVGLIFNTGIIPISFDDYVMTAEIDSTFSGFAIDTLPVVYNFNNQEINIKLTGEGKFNSENEIDFTIKVITEIFPEITCNGVLIK